MILFDIYKGLRGEGKRRKIEKYNVFRKEEEKLFSVPPD
jgi:hypothetical protein